MLPKGRLRLSNLRQLRHQQQCLLSVNAVEIDVDGETLKLETGLLAKAADSSVTASIQGTSALVTLVCKPRTTYGGFLPLTVDYRQRWSAAGRIPTNYHRRELGPNESEILTSRLIDRMLRPLFPKGFGHDVQLTCDALSLDARHDPRVAAANAAACALLLSDVPWPHGPAALTRVVADVNGRRLSDTSVRRRTNDAAVDILVGGAAGRRLVMLDGAANDVPDNVVADCVAYGLEQTERIIERMLVLQEKCGKPSRDTLNVLFEPDKNLVEKIKLLSKMLLMEIFSDVTHTKLSRDKAVQNLRSQVFQQIRDSVLSCDPPQPQPDPSSLDLAFNVVFNSTFRCHFFQTGRRVDGRTADQLRPIVCQTDLFPALHGSAMFQRGQTQVLCSLTLDSMEAALKNDAISVFLGALKEKMFMLTYEFPQFANNELGIFSGRANRREIGHAALAEKALRSLMPEDFAFATRLACQVLESNGSSSMASVCAGSLALMDAGVPVKAPAAGVAIGLLSLSDDAEPSKPARRTLLTDINGLEDYVGDMDFKVAGTRRGLTAVQLDVKSPAGLSVDELREALERARLARLHVLQEMARQALNAPRQVPKPNLPASEEFVVPVTQRFKMTRMAGYNLRKLESDLGVQITQLDAQTYRIYAPNKDLLQEAKNSIDEMLEKVADQTKDLEFGAIYECQVVEVLENGISVTLSSGAAPVFVPNSQLDLRLVRHPSALGIELGQSILMKYFGRDPVNGQIRLSRKLLLKTAPDPVAVAYDNGAQSTSSPWARKSKA